jgi:dienelactone hydrolase
MIDLRSRVLLPRRPGLAIAALTLLAARAALAQSDTSYITLQVGNDTIAVERVVRAPGRMDGELVFRSMNARWNYGAALGADGLVTRLDNAFRYATSAPDSPPAQSAVLAFTGDSVIVDIFNPGAAKITQRLASKAGAMPFINPSFALIELAVMRARSVGWGSGGPDSVTIPLFAVSGGQTFGTTVTRLGADSVVVNLANAVSRLKVDASGQILGGSVPSQGLAIVRTHAAPAAALLVAKPDYSAPVDAPYTAQDVTIPTPRGYALAGTLTMPKGARGPVPAVVTITGSGQEDRDESIPMFKGYRPFRQVADTLGRRGIAVLRMDDRGYGASQGDARRATSADFADDIRAGLAWLRTRPDIDARRLGLIGHSEGGLIGPMVAADDRALRALVILAGPAYSGRRILEYQNRNLLDHDTSLTRPQRDSAYRVAIRQMDSLATAQPWMKFFFAYDPLPTARRVGQPVLILQGATDQQVTPEQAPLLADAIRAGGNRDVTMRVFPGANHLFVEDPSGVPSAYGQLASFRVRADVLGALADWVAAKLGPAAADADRSPHPAGRR